MARLTPSRVINIAVEGPLIEESQAFILMKGYVGREAFQCPREAEQNGKTVTIGNQAHN